MTSQVCIQTQSSLKLTELDPKAKTNKTPPAFRRKPLTQKALEKAQLVWSNVTVEPLIAALGICDRINAVSIERLNLEKACRNSFQYEDKICTSIMRGHNLTLYADQLRNSQEKVSELQTWVNFFLYLFPPFLLLFIGAYSDRTKRRKTFIVVPFFGYIGMSLGLMLSAYFFDAVPLVYNAMIQSILPGIFGYWIVLYMAIFTYISSITTSEERTFRIGVIYATNSAFNMLGAALMGNLRRYLNYVGAFSLVLFIYIGCVIYAILYIPEINRSDFLFVAENRPRRTSSSDSGRVRKLVGHLEEFFDFGNVRDTFVFLFRRNTSRDERKKHVKIVLMIVNGLVMWGPCVGEFTVMYLYTRSTFGWNDYMYSTFYTIFYFTEFLGTFFCIICFIKYLDLHDSLVGVIAVVSTLIGALIFAFAKSSFIFCSGALAALFSNTSFIAMRSIISKLTSAEELGKVMSTFMIFEAVAPLLYNPLYGAVYTLTQAWMPSAFLLMSVLLTSPALFIFLLLYYRDRKHKLRIQIHQITPNVKK